MKTFDYSRPSSVSKAIAGLNQQSLALAGGTDLLSLMKADLRQPDAVVDIKRTDLRRDIRVTDQGVSIGALATISDIEHCTALDADYRLLIEAAQQTATPQLRNRATMGGNLLQAPRCWYFRDPDVQCWLKGGDVCPARTGRNELHALISDSPCVAVHPSDLAGCLVALDASVTLASGEGRRSVALEHFYDFPREERRQSAKISASELLLSIEIPALQGATRTTYLKAMARKAWTFALVGVAAVVAIRDDGIESATVVVNGVAPMPWKLRSNASSTTRMTAAEVSADLCDKFSADAQALGENRYKIALAHGLIEQAVGKLLEQPAYKS